MVDRIDVVYVENKTVLSWSIELSVVCYQNQTRQGNDMIDRTGADYTKNETELSWSIRLNVACDENQIG